MESDETDAGVELRIQSILDGRRRNNASGQDGEDIEHIRAALMCTAPNAGCNATDRSESRVDHNVGRHTEE